MDKEQFIRIVDANRKLIYKVCVSFCPDPDDRKDLEQDILVRIWKGIEKFDEQAKISTWIYRLALNTAISFHRSRKRQGHKVPVESALSLHNALETRNSDIELLYRFIGKLKELDKALILLYLDDVKYTEIAEILGITPTNVATKIGRIKKQLKGKYDGIE